MKNKIVAAALLLIAFVAPLSAKAEFRWGATASYVNNNLVFKQDLVDVKPISGASAGVIGEMMFPGIGFGLSFGLDFNMQGGQVDLGQKKVWSSLGYGNETLNVFSANIPVHLRFKYTRLNGIEDIIAPLVYGGPDFNIQVGHSKCDAIKYSGGDLGLTVGGGAEICKRWQVTGGYTWGMTYILKTKLLDNFSARPRQWHVRVAYMF